MPAPITTTLLALAFLVHECGDDGVAIAVGVVALLWQLVIFAVAAVVDDAPESS